MKVAVKAPLDCRFACILSMFVSDFLSVQISQVCSDFHFHSNRKSLQVVQKLCVYIFIFLKRKSRHPYLSKFYQCVRKSIHTLENLDRYVCLDLRFEENENLNTLNTNMKIFEFRFLIYIHKYVFCT